MIEPCIWHWRQRLVAAGCSKREVTVYADRGPPFHPLDWKLEASRDGLEKLTLSFSYDANGTDQHELNWYLTRWNKNHASGDHSTVANGIKWYLEARL